MNSFKFSKSLIALVLCFTFAFTMLPCVNSMASTMNLYDEDFLNSALLLQKLCPDLPLSDGEITTRGEFTASVIMLLGTAKGADCKTDFNDVSETHPYAAYIKSAADMGLVNNVELFYPDSPITYAQAVKIVMCAAGYGKRAEFSGGYPTGYLNEARRAGIKLSLGNDDTLSHAKAAELIFEGATIDIMEPSSFGSSFEYTITEGKNILSVYRDVFMACGIVSATRHTGLRSISSATGNDFITVDGENYLAPGCDSLLGKKVRVFYKDDEKNTAVHIYECDNKSYVYTNDDDIAISGNKITVSQKDATKDILHSIEPDFTVIYNGKCYNTSDYSSCINPSSGSVELTDNNANGNIDVIVITEIEYGVISGINSEDEKLYDKYVANGIKNLGDSQVSYSVTESDGTPLTIDDLESGDTLGYISSKDSKLVKIIRYNKKAGGMLEYLTSDGKLSMGGSDYVLSDYYNTNIKSLSNIKPGKEYIFHLGLGNTIIYVQDFEASVKYGFLVAAGKNFGLDGNSLVKIYGDDGAMHEIPLAEKLMLDGTSVSKAQALSELEVTESKNVLLKVVKYSTNAKGELNKIYRTVENTEGTKVFLSRTASEACPVLYDDNTKHGYDSSSSAIGKLVFKNDTFYPYFTLAPDCIIMKVPKDESERMNDKYYAIGTSADVRSEAAANGDAVACFGYDVDMDGVPFILWVSDMGGSSSVAEEASNAIVESVTKGTSPDGEECYVLKLFTDGVAEKYYSTEDCEVEVSLVKPGDIIQISANSEREITAVNRNFIYSTKTITGNATDVQGYNGGRLGLASGYLYNFSGKSGMIVRHKTIDEITNATESFAHTDMFPISLTRGKIYFVKFNRNRTSGEIVDAIVYTESDTSSVESFYSSGKDADYVVQRARFHDVSYTVIYTN